MYASICKPEPVGSRIECWYIGDESADETWDEPKAASITERVVLQHKTRSRYLEAQETHEEVNAGNRLPQERQPKRGKNPSRHPSPSRGSYFTLTPEGAAARATKGGGRGQKEKAKRRANQ